jgi:hypothetical protein
MCEERQKKTLCVDFDHTITHTENEYEYGSEKPNHEVIEWLKEMYYAGHTIIVWTARPWSEANIIASRLTEWGVRWHGLRCEKGGGDVYVDDKAVNVKVGNWKRAAESTMARQKMPPTDTGESEDESETPLSELLS